MFEVSLKEARRVYFIGIGGIGMSAAAQFFLAEGKEVSGSDLGESPVVSLLKNKGAKIFFEQKASNIDSSIDLVVYTLAILSDNSELKEAKRLKIPTLSYPEILGVLSHNKYTIAISGTHGKTTTTAMIAKIMVDAGLSPTVIAGSLMNEYKSNFVYGKSKYFLVEACEYRRSFLHLNPNILVIANIEAEHLDYYKNLEDIQDGFISLVKKLKEKDFLICDMNDEKVRPVMEEAKCQIIDYPSLEGASIRLKVPGKHNIKNAKAAFSVAAVFGIDNRKASKSLESFSGTWRRLEPKGKTPRGALVFDDYAHHPTEIKATLSSVKELYPDKRIVVAFQPHLFSRTKTLLLDFAESFEGVSEVITLPIYAAREPDDPTINSQILSEKIKEARTKSSFSESFEKASETLKKDFNSSYVIVTMGAGDIYKVSDLLVR
jgi:UDP-N-acetylmuramate--alanine ligase